MSHLYRDNRRVLLIDSNAHKLNLRAAILRNHEVEVHAARGFEEIANWKVIPYDLILLAFREGSRQAADATEEIRRANPRQRIALLVGPPTYIREVDPAPRAKHRGKDSPRLAVRAATGEMPTPQWQEIVQKVVTDWYLDPAVAQGLS